MAQLKSVYLIADSSGNALDYNSDTYDAIGFDRRQRSAQILAHPKPQLPELRRNKDRGTVT